MANGFANRYIITCIKRARFLPRGGRIESVDFNPIVKRLHDAKVFANEPHEIVWSAAAGSLWDEVYPTLSADVPGLVGAITSRSEAQTLRLALIYALLDCSRTIEVSHLEAALAVWNYAEESARFLFGDSLGDTIADSLLKAIREAGEVGLTRTQISNVLGRNVSAGRIASSLKALVGRFVSEQTDEPSEVGGRPTTRYVAVRQGG